MAGFDGVRQHGLRVFRVDYVLSIGSRHTVATTDEGLTGVNDLGLWDLLLVKRGCAFVRRWFL